MYEDDDEDDQTKAAASTRGTDPQPTDRAVQTMSATAAPAATPQAQRFAMPWQRGPQGGMPWGQQPGNTGVVGPGQGQPLQQGGHPGFGWGQPGGMGQGPAALPNWQALAQQFQQRFAQNNPFLQRLGMTGMGQVPPGQAPAAPPAGLPAGGAPGAPPPQGAPGRSPPFYAGPQVAQGQPMQGQGGPLQGRLQQLAQMFGRNRQPGGIVGPGQGGQQY